MKKIKLLTASLASATLLSSTSLFATGCSCANDQLAKDVVTKAIDEFYEIAKIPRPSKYTGPIREYLMKRVTELGYEPHTDWVASKDPTDPGNVWFDIPASEGCENLKGCFLQAHMDMVVAGLTKEEAKTTPIVPEYHEDTQTITSKDKKTSLGADNGIGLGMILSIAQNKEIKHGPIRAIFTADEEDGMGGAKRLAQSSSDVLAPYDNLINIDGELDRDGYYRSCQGSVGYDFTHTSTTETKSITTEAPLWNLFVSGFKGGHSGNDINKGRCSATVFLLSVLDKLNDSNLQIQKYTHEVKDAETGYLKDTPPSRSAIPSLGRVYFVSTKTESEINAAFEATKTEFAKEYAGEEWDNVKITLEKESVLSTCVLTTSDTQKVINLITNKNDDGIEFGPYIVDPETQRPLLSSNIGPLAITPNLSNPSVTYLTLQTYSRSVAKTGVDLLKKYVLQAWNNYFYDSAIEYNPDVNYPWEIDYDDSIQKLANEGYKSIGIDPYIRDTNGGVEPLWFAQRRPDLQQTCLGTKFENVHTVNETVYIKPLLNTTKVLKYMLENLK